MSKKAYRKSSINVPGNQLLDLKRKLKIEAALESIRSRTMLMKTSDDFAGVVTLLFKELRKLGGELSTCRLVLCTSADHSTEQWLSLPGEGLLPRIKVSSRQDKFHRAMYAAWKAKKKYFRIEIKGKDLKRHYELMFKEPVVDVVLKKSKKQRTPLTAKQINHVAPFKQGYLLAVTAEPYEEIDLFIRFAKELERSYTRFLDLKHAEAQAREAQIETALERIRSSAMAMHSSEDILEVTRVLREQVALLGEKELESILVHIYKEDTDQFEAWYSYRHPGNAEKQIRNGKQLLSWSQTARARKDKEKYNEGSSDYCIVADYKMLKEWYEYLLEKVPEVVEVGADGKPIVPNVLHYNYSKISGGALLLITNSEASDHSKYLLRRAATVFNLAYLRFTDIQKAEAQAYEAIKQSSLDRVRADIASMRTTKDLERITPLIWNELTTLAVPFIRCGVFIMDEEEQKIHTFLSTPNGKAIAAFHSSYQDTAILAEAVSYWRLHQRYVTNWKDQDFKSQADTLLRQGSITSREQYLHAIPIEGVHLHFLPFQQGMLYVGNTSALNDEQLDLIQAIADAFSTAYARYEDFNKLEIAKQQVDKALVELKQAQQQLIQSEKMASLGEMTAGIAHEIQNPLNFVNNFSEVNKELLSEMEEAIRKGDLEDALALAKTVVDNQEKINYHGKRADGIVKGMLQHSRSSSGQKELTDMNVLCDEYLRLAYHGYRAKDKSFNAKFETDFDLSLPKINVVPQDIGRVILNLINNAFYAVNEKEGLKVPGYNPHVIVSTKNLGDKIEIRVKDNGNGIPDSIKKKIFQPFFTTKPSGQGTGLGLSLSYDIVKAHGGEIEMGSQGGKGSVFLIILALKTSEA
ncbi:MAG TPA: ATP-binding protein [Chryseolinea sp.]